MTSLFTTEPSTNNSSSLFANDGTTKKATTVRDEESFPSLSTPQEASTGTKAKQSFASISQRVVAPSTKVSRVFELPQSQQNIVALKKKSLADHCMEAAKACNVTVDASTSSANKLITVVINGKEQDVMNAKKLLWQRISEKTVVAVSVPAECLKYLVGPSGKTIQSIHESVGNAAHIEVPAKDAQYDGKIRIVGDNDAVEKAKAMIEDIVKERKTRAQVNIGDVSATQLPFLFDHFDWSFNGKSEWLGTKLGCKVVVNHHAGACSIALVGDQETINKAHKIISEEIASTQPISIVLRVPKALHKHLIGPKASILHQLQMNNKCLIDVPSQESVDEQITITAMPENLPEALKAVLDITSSFVTRLATCSEAGKHFLLHNHRQLIRDIENVADVSLNNVHGGFEVEGRRERVIKAVEMFREKALPLISGLNASTIGVPRGYLKHIIGKQGQRIQQLGKDCHVEVMIEDTEEHASVTLLATDKESVSKAKQVIDALIHELDERTGNVNVPTISASLSFPVDPEYHLLLQGPQGRNLKHLDTKYGVRVVFPRDTTQSQDILVYGPDERARQARDELLELLRVEKARNYEEQIDVPSKSLPLIIGKSGSTIQALRNEYDVIIDVHDAPNKSSEARIVAKGTEEHCKAVIQKIKGMLIDVPDIPLDEALAHLVAYRWSNEFMQWKDQTCPGSRLLVNERRLVRMDPTAFKTYQSQTLNKLVTARCLGVPNELFGSVIGQGGAVRRKLADAHKVDIWVPNASSHPSNVPLSIEIVPGMSFDSKKDKNCIQVTGRTESTVKQAAEAILALVRDRHVSSAPFPADHTLVIAVPHSLHRHIIGRRGAKIGELRSIYKCNIIIPNADSGNDEIKLTGPNAASLDACAEAIRALVESNQ